MPETSEPARAVPPSAARPNLEADPQSRRFVIERAKDGGGRAVYEVLDKSRHPKRRVICRTNLADAMMIVAALEIVEAHSIQVVGSLTGSGSSTPLPVRPLSVL